MKKYIFYTLIGLLIFNLASAQQIIPQPFKRTDLTGLYTVGDNPTIGASAGLKNEVAFLARLLEESYPSRPVEAKGKSADIYLSLLKEKDNIYGREGYKLAVGREGINIEAATPTGVFYGIQSLHQLIVFKGQEMQVNYVEILDKPRFAWRSYMLDEGRYFKGKALVKRMLDEMALLKMNIFHWHLTEDQGWRLAIDAYPKLTKVGGKRDSTQIGGWNSKVYDGKEHAGYYTKADVLEIIRYATERHIQIIPEIEMPGHSSAAIAAYPWLGVTKQRIKVPTSFGVKYDTFDVSDPKVVTFLQQVLDEVIALFPSDVVHIGGDEVKYDQWLKSESVQRYMKMHHLASPADLQIAFTNKMSNYLEKKGKRMMGWNDIMGAKLHDYNDAVPVTGNLAKSTIIQFWKGDLDMVKDAVSKGYEVVNSYHVFTYLDYDYQSIPLKKAYDFDPVPEGLDAQYAPQILGLGCQMWGEWIPTEAALYQQTFPRIAAYAEVGWTSKDQKDFHRFQQALQLFYKRWDKEGIGYHKPS